MEKNIYQGKVFSFLNLSTEYPSSKFTLKSFID